MWCKEVFPQVAHARGFRSDIKRQWQSGIALWGDLLSLYLSQWRSTEIFSRNLRFDGRSIAVPLVLHLRVQYEIRSSCLRKILEIFGLEVWRISVLSIWWLPSICLHYAIVVALKMSLKGISTVSWNWGISSIELFISSKDNSRTVSIIPPFALNSAYGINTVVRETDLRVLCNWE